MSDDGEINYETIPRVDLKASDLAAHILEDGDFLIERSGTCGSPACIVISAYRLFLAHFLFGFG